MTSSIYFTYSGQSHYDCAGKLIDVTYRYVAYPKDKRDIVIGDYLNMQFTNRQEVLTKKMIENFITWGFESYSRRVRNIMFGENYQDKEYNTPIKTDFYCTMEYEYL